MYVALVDEEAHNKRIYRCSVEADVILNVTYKWKKVSRRNGV